jgi:RHS repeat-associated protein
VSDINTSLPVTIDDGTRTYVWGNGLAYAVSDSSIEVYHADRLGSVRAISDAAGTVTATYRTDEYGIPTASSGSTDQPFGFTGEPRDATGLSYLRARYYDSSLGRFMSQDPWPGTRSAPSTLNSFSYVSNNPATYVDPSGRCLQSLALAVAGPPGAASGVGITLGCVVLGFVLAGTGAAAVGVGVGRLTAPLVNEIRGDPTTLRRIPEIDPETWDRHMEIIQSYTGGWNVGEEPPPSSGGGNWCRRHPIACSVAPITIPVSTMIWHAAQGGADIRDGLVAPAPVSPAPKPQVLRGP